MQLDFTPEERAHIAQIAMKAGTDPERLVKDAVLRLLDEDDRFMDAVRRGEGALDRGEFLTHEQMGERVRRFLHS
jgi:predicted transcriptional regulator